MDEYGVPQPQVTQSANWALVVELIGRSPLNIAFVENEGPSRYGPFICRAFNADR